MHKDNTFRALKGEEPFVDRFLCRFGWHRWSKWSAIQRSPGGMFVTQHRYCIDCNRSDKRKAD